MFLKLSDFEERRDPSMSATVLSQQLTGKIAAQIDEATVFFIAPPAVPGLGNGSGFMMMIQDRSGAGHDALAAVTMDMMMWAQQVPEVTQVFPRSEERRVGTGGARTGRVRWGAEREK